MARIIRLCSVALIAGIAAAGAAVHATVAQVRTPGAAPRSIVVVSDLHMGAGRAPSGAWHASEDFRWATEFSAFLTTVDRDGRSNVDLVLNGDTFDLLETSTGPCRAPADDIGCREADALARMERVLAAHDAEIDSLSRFARSGSNRITFVPGDHDAALLFPAVARRLVGAVAPGSSRVDVAATGYWRSADGKIYAEHGHQIGASPHRFDNWPRPFVTRDGVEYLARPWGERAIQALSERFEERYPIVDNFALIGAGLKYALAADGVADAGEAAPQLLRYFLSLVSWQQFRMELDGGETEPPTWDLAQVRAQGGNLLVSSLPDDDRFKPLAAKALADGHLNRAVALTDAELVALCDYRAASRRARRRGEPFLQQFAPRGPVVTECPRTAETRGSLFDYFWRSRDQTFGAHLDGVARQLPNSARPSVFVHGHTHVPDRGQESALSLAAGLLTIPRQGFSPVRNAVTPVVINGGAWQRTITPVQYERLETERGSAGATLLRTLQPEDLAPCYAFVQIPTYAAVPDPSVRYWRQSASGDWSIAGSCGR